jgi:transposase-like protein
MTTCPYCQSSDEQVKNGLNPSGSQRYQCNHCQRTYTPQPTHHGYAPVLREQAIQYYVDGINLRRIARMLGVNHQTVANWVNTHVRRLPPASVPAEPETVELDELFTFVGKKTLPTS